jgi:hypothetical protein
MKKLWEIEDGIREQKRQRYNHRSMPLGCPSIAVLPVLRSCAG